MLYHRRGGLPAALLVGAATLVAAPLLTLHRTARASVSVAFSLADLVAASDAVVVGHAGDRTSRWEGGRIVTYTDVFVDRDVTGHPSLAPIVVRTLGGTVGDLGQRVVGEASVPERGGAMLFTRTLTGESASFAKAGAKGITGMEQGVMPVTLDGASQKVGASARSLGLLAPKGLPQNSGFKPAVLQTQGRPLEDVILEVRSLWNQRDKK